MGCSCRTFREEPSGAFMSFPSGAPEQSPDLSRGFWRPPKAHTQGSGAFCLRDGTYYQDLGAEYFTRRNPAQAAARLANRIRNLGYHVEIRAAA
jgi:hypothetical protein